MIRNIQALRAVAAYLVVFVHLSAFLGTGLVAIGVSPTILEMGAIGVDLFFVVSGFIMVTATSGRVVTPRAFIVDRLLRVVPAYWIMTFVYFALGLMLADRFPDLRFSPVELAQSLLFIPYARASGAVMPVLFVGWTLNYEMMFYVLFALALPIRSTVVRVGVLAAALGGLVVSALVVPSGGGVAYRFYADPVVLEFVLGMILGVVHARGRHLPREVAWVVLLIGISLPFGRFVVGDATRLLWGGVPSALVVAAVLGLERDGVVWRGRVVQALGAASYVLYLIHPLLISIAGIVARRFGLLDAPVTAAVCALVLLAMLGIAAVLAHRVLERPVHDWLRRRAGQGHPLRAGVVRRWPAGEGR